MLSASDIYTSVTQAAEESPASHLGSFISDETQAAFETRVDKTLINHKTQVVKTPVTSEMLTMSKYGEPIPQSLFLHILDHGFLDLITGVASAAPLLFYWTFTRQQSSVLQVIYKEAQAALSIPASRIARAIDRIRTSDLFIVKNNREGLFIDLSPLIKKVKTLYPDLTSETLPVSSSSLLLKNTTTDMPDSGTLVWKNIKPTDFRVLVDVLHYCKYSKKDISLKLITAMAQLYTSQNGDLLNLALNLFYASSHATGSSSAKISYLLKSLKEDWGGTTSTLDEIDRIKKLLFAFRVLREENIQDKSTKELRQYMLYMGKHPHEEITRDKCLSEIKDFLSLSDELFAALSQLSGRSDDSNAGVRFKNPSTTKYI
jgi:hypothetical protein